MLQKILHTGTDVTSDVGNIQLTTELGEAPRLSFEPVVGLGEQYERLDRVDLVRDTGTKAFRIESIRCQRDGSSPTRIECRPLWKDLAGETLVHELSNGYKDLTTTIRPQREGGPPDDRRVASGGARQR